MSFSEPWPTAAELKTLEAMVDTLIPPRNAPGVYAGGGLTMEIPEAMVDALSEAPPWRLEGLRRFLAALENPWFVRLLGGERGGLSQTPPVQRERVLRELATSPIPTLRGAYQAFRRLAMFLFYALPDGSGTNPVWAGMGYEPSANPLAPIKTEVLLTRPDESGVVEADVCVIGSGAGGSVIAAELAATGRRVVVMEASVPDQGADFDQHELTGMRRLFAGHGLLSTHDFSVMILAGAALGGGTATNWQTSLPLPDDVREEWTERSGIDFFVKPAWDVSIKSVMARLHVSTQESVLNGPNACLRRGCEALGFSWQTVGRNARGCDVSQCGYCFYGCRIGGKQSAAVTWLLDAQQLGETVVIPECRADRILIDGGTVQGVQATAVSEHGETVELTVRARQVVLAAGALASPALLVKSGVDLPHVGRHLYLHPTSSVVGRYDETVEAWKGPPQTVMCDEFARLRGPYGCRIETVPAHPGLMALATPWYSGLSHRILMEQAASVSPFIVLTRDETGGHIEVNRQGDTEIHYRVDRPTHTLLRQGLSAAARIHAAAGATQIFTLHSREHYLRNVTAGTLSQFCDRLRQSAVARNWSPLFSAHQMGTCRMGRDPRQAVCSEEGEVFGVKGLFVGDASAFPASSGVNPMIAIMALAHHTAQAIKTR